MPKPTNIPVISHDWAAVGRDGRAPCVGGESEWFTAGGTLLVGDAVYISAANTVNKSATAATTLGAYVGQVISGTQLDGEYPETLSPIGKTAATVNQKVLVLFSGFAPAIAGAAVAAGDRLTASGAVAGRLITDAAPATGTSMGNAVTAAAGAASGFLIFINHR